MKVEALADDASIEAEYIAVGHVTLDTIEGGGRQPGGSVLYAALLAARLGWDTAIVTSGHVGRLTELLAPLADGVRVLVAPGAAVTTLHTAGSGLLRTQSVVAHAGPVPRVSARGRVIHLAPVAREVGVDWCSDCTGYVGLTPQGILRRWGDDGRVVLHEPPELGAAGADAIVISEVEEPYCGPLFEDADRRPLIVVTREDRPATAWEWGVTRTIPPIHVEVRADLGAGDVFAAALFAARTETDDVEAAVRFAHAAAAARLVGDPGPAGVPSRSDVERYLS